MIDNHDIDPEILEYLENEFLAYDLLDPPLPQQHTTSLLSSTAIGNRPTLPLFQRLHPTHHIPAMNNSNQVIAARNLSFLEEDLTPVPLRRTNSFDNHNLHNNNSNHHRTNSSSLLNPTPSVYDVKLVCEVVSLQGPSKVFSREETNETNPWMSCIGSFHYFTLSIKIFDELRVYKLVRSSSLHPPKQTKKGKPSSAGGDAEVIYSLKPMPSSGNTASKSRSGAPEIWEFADYYGSTAVEFVLRKHSRFTFQSTVIAKTNVPLAHFYDEQRQQEKSLSYFSKQNDYNWLQSLLLELEMTPTASGIIRRFSGNTGQLSSINNNSTVNGTNNLDWWSSLTQGSNAAKKGRFSQPKYLNTPQSPHLNNATIQRGTAAAIQSKPSKAVIKLKLAFRIIFLQNCVKQTIQTTFLLPSTEGRNNVRPHLLSDFHVLVAKAPAHLLVEVMKSLAWRGMLPKVLSTPTSEGYWPLEVALRVGNHAAVLELLQRTGYLCFPPLLNKHSSPLHHCAVGNSTLCFEYLQKFLKRFGGGPRGSATPNLTGRLGNRNSQQMYENMTWDNCLEWKDEKEHTPFTLSCSLPQRTAMIRELLLAGANIASINSQTNYTPFMYACEQGDVEIVEVLLSIQDIPKGEQEVIEQIRSSRNALRMVSNTLMNSSSYAKLNNSSSLNDENSMYPSPLSLASFSCLPSYRDPVSGKQAIHLAAEKGHLQIVMMLLRIGVSCCEVDRDGRTIYHIAVERKSEELIDELIEVERLKWKNYLQISQPSGYEHMKSCPKPLFIRNSHGKLPLDVAMDDENDKIALRLIKGMLDVYGVDNNKKKTARPSPPTYSSSSTPLKAAKSSNFITLNISSIRRQESEEIRRDFPPTAQMSVEMYEWLQQMRKKLENPALSSADPYKIDFNRRQQQRIMDSAEGKEVEQKDNKDDLRSLSTNLPQSSVTTCAVEDVLEEKSNEVRAGSTSKISHITPFSSDWIGNLRGGLAHLRREEESKEETLALEEKEDEFEKGIQIAKEEAEESRIDHLEYLFALTPLSLKSLNPEAEV